MKRSLREEQEALFKRQRKETESLTFSTTNRYTNSLFSLVSVQSSRHSLQGPGFLWRRLMHTHISGLRLWALGIRIWKKIFQKNPTSSPLSERTNDREVRQGMTKGEDLSILILLIHFCQSCGSGQCMWGAPACSQHICLGGARSLPRTEPLLSSHWYFSSSEGWPVLS